MGAEIIQHSTKISFVNIIVLITATSSWAHFECRISNLLVCRLKIENQSDHLFLDIDVEHVSYNVLRAVVRAIHLHCKNSKTKAKNANDLS